MKRARGPVRRLRRFDSGGEIPPITPGPNAQIYQPKTQNIGSSVMSGIQAGLQLGKAFRDSGSSGKDSGGKGGDGGSSGSGVGSPGVDTATLRQGEQESYKRGGTIRKTYGPKIGKEDGIIAAQKGEYVVRKSAVNKLGKKALDTINKGKLPAKGKGASRGR